ncbi:MAG TPA: replication initiator protein A, partial [Azospirillaceae bacterium]|nr:replication initiator protein A [Azospirillaceae bacterium]
MSTTTMQALLPGLDSPLIGSVKNERAIMVYPFFNLSAVDKKTELPVYDDGRVRIEVKGTKSGVATIYDAEFVIYVASLMVDKMNRGLPVTQSFSFSGHDFFRVTGVSVGGKNYERFEGALDRLQGTQIKTNIETGGEGTDEWFSWCKTAKVEYRKNAKGEKIIKRITVELCDWLYRAILKDNRMLTYDPVYFKLPPLEKRLYEMARAHCGNQAGFKIGLEKLRMRVGSDLALKDFKSRLVKIA